MKLHTITYGCQMSVADGEEMSVPLLRRGYTPTPDLDAADAVLLNTCTVRQHAEDKALSLIGRLRLWKEERPDRLLIVAGCAAERIAPWLTRRFPHIDLIAGAKSIEQFPELLDAALERRFDSPLKNIEDESSRADAVEGGTAYLTIIRGCNYSCTYCIVPSVRGREIHRPFVTLLEEARERAKAGAVEMMLLGQTVNAYKDATGRDFADLLRAIQEVEGIERIRFTSPHPFYLTEKLMRAMAECPKIAPHLHLPAQSGSDKILKAMRRNYTRKMFLERTRRLREFVPDLALSTDLIVGFPGETEEDFAKTMSFVDEADFCAAYCYKFSPRGTTEAAAMTDTVPREVSEDRLDRLLNKTLDRTGKHLKALLGKPVKILLADETDGRTQYHFKARLDSPGRPGSIVEAVATGATRTALRCSALPMPTRKFES